MENSALKTVAQRFHLMTMSARSQGLLFSYHHSNPAQPKPSLLNWKLAMVKQILSPGRGSVDLSFSGIALLYVSNDGAGSGAVQVKFVDGMANPTSLQNLPTFPGLNSAYNVVFNLAPDTVMACDGDKSCWRLKPGTDSVWNPASTMLYTQTQANKNYFDFGNEIMFLGSCMTI